MARKCKASSENCHSVRGMDYALVSCMKCSVLCDMACSKTCNVFCSITYIVRSDIQRAIEGVML